MSESLEFSKMSDEAVKKALKDHKIGLTVDEARKIETILGRAPTLTEAVIWGIQGSEHCSYRSSRKYLKQLPTTAPNVILGPVEDAGVVEIAKDPKTGKRWGLIMSHESHNHPSQIVPYEGAATGIGGNVRDVACMGGKVIGVLDSLRFGDPAVNECRIIANEVVRGIAGYGNPIGVPNLGGDIYFDPAFNESCLVNVLTVGLVAEDEIIHSYPPDEAGDVGYDIITVGKPTDNSGMGGAAFSSLVLDEKDKETNKGAVQEPNPFLKRHLLAATYDLFAELKKMGKLDKVGFKDMGAGGNVCSTVEQVEKKGFGAEIDLEKIHIAMEGLHPSVIACSETQERFAWTCHPELTQMILDHYNTKWDLGSVAENARASLVGKVTKGGQYILWYKGQKECDATAKDICEGLRYDREVKPKTYNVSEPVIDEKALDLNKLFVQLMGSINIASRRPVYNKYDKDVQGNSIIEAGETDSGVIAPLLDNPEASPDAQKVGVALTVDGNSNYSKISPYWQAANAVVEAARNIAATGATPQCITDCLNYNNPEVPELMWEFTEGVRGITDACKGLPLKNHPDFPLPVISGNVSLYNQVDATADIGMMGVIQNYEKAVTQSFKKAGNPIYLIGPRKNELGASEFYKLLGHVGMHVPQVDFDQAKKEIYAVIDAIDAETLAACHDISEGGLLCAVAEMAMHHDRTNGGKFGATLDITAAGPQGMPAYQKAFSQTGGFVCEVKAEKVDEFGRICARYGVVPIPIGHVSEKSHFDVRDSQATIISQPLNILQDIWLNGLAEKLQ